MRAWRGAFHALLAHFVYFVVRAVKTTDSLVFYLSSTQMNFSFAAELAQENEATKELLEEELPLMTCDI